MPKEKEAPKKEAPKSKDSDEKKAFAKVIESYKEQNPEKYEVKKAALEAKLAKL